MVSDPNKGKPSLRSRNHAQVPRMAHSLSEGCTPLKHQYDTCFNAWFEGYLEPAIAVAATPQQRAEHSKQKAAEYEEKCGKIWESYRLCVQKALKDKGLDTLLHQAREENPLTEPPSVEKTSDPTA